MKNVLVLVLLVFGVFTVNAQMWRVDYHGDIPPYGLCSRIFKQVDGGVKDTASSILFKQQTISKNETLTIGWDTAAESFFVQVSKRNSRRNIYSSIYFDTEWSDVKWINGDTDTDLLMYLVDLLNLEKRREDLVIDSLFLENYQLVKSKGVKDGKYWKLKSEVAHVYVSSEVKGRSYMSFRLLDSLNFVFYSCENKNYYDVGIVDDWDNEIKVKTKKEVIELLTRSLFYLKQNDK